MRWRTVVIGACLSAVVVTMGACGDDGDDSADATAAFCDYSAGLGAAPSESELDELARLAPSDIASDVETYADGLTRIVTESDGALTAEEERAAANVDAWELTKCTALDEDTTPVTPSDTEPVEIDDLDLGEIEPDGGDLGEITDIEVLDEPVEDFDSDAGSEEP